MSEFTCRNGHLMAPTDGLFCKECGERCVRMDGKSNGQLRYEEEMAEKEEEREREREEE